MDAPSSSRIREVGGAFRQSKTLLSAVELGVFTALGAQALTGSQLLDALGLHPRANPDFFDALVALRFLDRDGSGPDARYRNTPDSAMFLDRQRPEYIGRLLEMVNDRLYPSWGGLTAALRTGLPQSETHRWFVLRVDLRRRAALRAVRRCDGRPVERQLPRTG